MANITSLRCLGMHIYFVVVDFDYYFVCLAERLFE